MEEDLRRKGRFIKRNQFNKILQCQEIGKNNKIVKAVKFKIDKTKPGTGIL